MRFTLYGAGKTQNSVILNPGMFCSEGENHRLIAVRLAGNDDDCSSKPYLGLQCLDLSSRAQFSVHRDKNSIFKRQAMLSIRMIPSFETTDLARYMYSRKRQSSIA